MEECRFKSSELQASLMASTPLLTDSWSLCNTANRNGTVKIQDIPRITYVAVPAVPMPQLGNLVSLDVSRDRPSPGLTSEEPLPPMVDASIPNLFSKLKMAAKPISTRLRRTILRENDIFRLISEIECNLWLNFMFTDRDFKPDVSMNNSEM
ncbi:lipase-like PAD4 [Capsella rubella]|uniref:lipase-like PAD4 n=1 Tax=Capsella rubella TaxID=81985 RepID=UPI000CD4E98C|nr:lipase-like PAD4 [Capsella rubella]